MIEPQVAAANDNAVNEEGRPAVMVLEDRPELTYARHGNLLLPLRFARLMPGWNGEQESCRIIGHPDGQATTKVEAQKARRPPW